MKKIILILAFVCMCFSLIARPVNETVEDDKTNLSIVALKGPTAMGLVKLMDRSEKKSDDLDNSYTFTIEASPDAVTPLIAKNEVDIACIPANLAAVLYNNTGKIQVVAINTLGVLYLVGRTDSSISSLDDIKGRTIYSAGKGSTPEYAIETILSGYGLVDGIDVRVEWKSEHAECVAALMNDENALALLPQPLQLLQ